MLASNFHGGNDNDDEDGDNDSDVIIPKTFSTQTSERILWLV